MACNPAKLPLWIIPVLLVGISPTTISAHQTPPESSVQSVTGCVQKGTESGGYTLAAADGKVWELRSTSVKLAPHVGHTVTVTGTPTEASPSQEAKIENDEKKEAEGKQHADFQVTGLKMISKSCK